jgi:hypothetical protein
MPLSTISQLYYYANTKIYLGLKIAKWKLLLVHPYNEELSWSWLYGSWIYNYLYNQCLPHLKLWVQIPLMVSCTLYNIVIKFVSDFRQVGGFPLVQGLPYLVHIVNIGCICISHTNNIAFTLVIYFLLKYSTLKKTQHNREFITFITDYHC